MAKQKLAGKVRAYLKALENGKRGYKRADELMAEILEKGMKAGDQVTLNGGRKARLKDNFEGKNTVYRAHGIHRFEIEVIE